jgi:hypothetical protein
MSFPGNKNNQRLRKKYGDCEYVVVYGSTVRQLTKFEIDELQAHIERLRNPTIHVKQTYRRSIV